MTNQVAFIRAIMLGRGGIERESLLEAFVRAGAQSPRSHIATGNVTFEAAPRSVPGIVAAVEAELVAMAGTPKKLFVRSEDDLLGLAQAAPFANWTQAAAAHELAVIFLSARAEIPLSLPAISERGDTTYISRTEREIFIATHLIGGRPGNPGAWLERRLKAPVTVRNWNTVTRILRHWETDR